MGLFEESECAGSRVCFGLEGGVGLWAIGVSCVGMSDTLRAVRVEWERHAWGGELTARDWVHMARRGWERSC